MREALAVPGFRRLYGGLTASMFGDSIMLLVLSMWVKTLTGSNAQAGLAFLFMTLPALAAPLLGAWVDRCRRLPVLVWGHVASAVGVLPLVFVRDASHVWIIWLVAFGYGLSFIVLPAALNGLLKELMPEELLVTANSAMTTTKEAYRLFGPLVGAALFASVGGWLVAVVDAVSFLVAAACIATIRVHDPRPARDGTHLLRQVKAGFSFLAGERVLRQVLVGFALMTLVIGFLESGVYALLDHFGAPATYASWGVSAMGVGAVIGGLGCSALVRRVGEVAAAVLGLAALALAVAGMAAAPNLVVALAANIPGGMGLPVALIALNTLVQRRTPSALMGRVSTAVEILLTTPQAVSLAVGSALVVLWDWRWIFALTAGMTALGAAWIAVTLRDLVFGRTRAVPDPGPGDHAAVTTPP